MERMLASSGGLVFGLAAAIGYAFFALIVITLDRFRANSASKDDTQVELKIVESINAVVSLRRIDPNARSVPEADVARVRAEPARHPHLRRHRAEAVKGEIMVYELIGGLTDEVADYLVASFQLTPAQLEQRRPQLEKGLQYIPVMRLVPADGQYELRRMTYRGAGGWSRNAGVLRPALMCKLLNTLR